MKFATLVALVLSFFCTVSNTTAQDWKALRGTDGTGLVNAETNLSKWKEQIVIFPVWKKKLGSGYSSVVVSGNHVITMYCDETNDRVGCFSAEDGSQTWSVPVGDKYKGENGSFDGPISTPLIHNGLVFCLTPAGKLYGLKVETGEEVWQRDVGEEFESKKPLYGFATSPIVVDGMLVFQAGGKEKSLVGLDPQTGETKWESTTDNIDSQSPAVVTVEGKQIILAAGRKLRGVDPADGKVLFEYDHEGGNGSAMVPVVFDGNKVVLTLDDAFSKAISIRKVGDDYQVSEEWQQPSIKNTYNIPVSYDDHLYAFSTRILTCVENSTGKAKWKSRKPGDGFLIVVDGHIIVNTKKGSLHILKATPEGFKQLTSRKIFDDLVWSLPAFSNNRVFMRSLGEIACVKLEATKPLLSNMKESEETLGASFKNMLAGLKAPNSDEHQTVVDQFLAKHKSFPIVEDGIAHFVFKGEATDVAVAGDFLGARQEKKMKRIEGTDVWIHGEKLPEDLRTNYIFLVDYKPQTDPRNTRTETSSMYAGEMEFAVRLRNEAPLKMSWFGMSKWNEPKFTAPVEKLAGTLIEKEFESKVIEGETIKLEVYVPPSKTPPGYGSDSRKFPVVYALNGAQAKTLGRLHEAMDNIVTMENIKSPQAIIVMVDGSPNPKFAEVLANEIVPFVDKEFHTIADRKSRICLSNGMASGSALSMLFKHNDVFGNAAVQTPLVFDAMQNAVVEMSKSVKEPSKLYLEWGQYDMFNPDENWDVRKIGKRLYDGFSENENLKVSGGQVNDTTDWASWRNRFDRVLDLLK